MKIRRYMPSDCEALARLMIRSAQSMPGILGGEEAAGGAPGGMADK